MGILTKRGEHYIFEQCAGRDIDVVSSAGFTYWEPVKSAWATKSPVIACALIEYTQDAQLKGELLPYRLQKERTVKLSKATSCNIELPSPSGLSYLPFQKAGVEFIYEHESSLLADEMGLGKTIQAIGLINAVLPDKTLIVCPASLKLNWKYEIERWRVDKDMTVSVVPGTSNDFPNSNIVIINYDILRHYRHELSITWDLVVADESTAIKNGSSGRARELTKIKARRKLLLTGTPILNRPEELWTTLRYLDPERWGNYNYFCSRYCGAKSTKYGYQANGHEHLDELNKILCSSIMIRRLKKDVLKELPPKFYQVIDIPCTNPTLVIEEAKKYEKIEAELVALKRAVELAKVSKNEKEYREAMLKFREFYLVRFSEISRIRHETAVYKLPSVLAHLSNATEGGKVVCFAHHRDIIDAICSKFAGATVSVVGGMTEQSKQDAKESFQNNPNVRLFVGSIKAAGFGLTLTASSHVVFAEMDWTPAMMSQCADRCHRIGQKDNVLVQYLVLDGSLDARVAHKLVEKQRIMDAAIDGIPFESEIILP